MKYRILFAINLCITLTLFAQPDILKKYDWSENPALQSLTENDRNTEEIILKDLTVLEFFYDDKDAFSEYELHHKITLLNSDLAINRNNKIYLSIENSTEIIVQKARVINRDGTVNVLKEEDIIDAADEESNSKFKYFALEGLQKGCQIEYFYIVKTIPVYSGSSLFFQDEIPRKNVEFKIYSPSNLVFKSKCLNGFPTLELCTTEDNKNMLSAAIDYIPSKHKEEYATYEPNLMQVIYKIDEDLLRDSKDIITYNDAALSVYNNIYQNIDKQELKLIRDYIKRMNVIQLLDTETKIRLVEQYIKSNVMVVDDNNSQEFEDITSIISGNIANKFGITKLYALIYNELGINNDIVLTCDRYEKRFEKDFQAYHFLEQYLFYFTDLNKFLIPTDPFYRLGFIPCQYTNNYGLFIHYDKADIQDNIKSEINFIPASDYTANGNNLSVNVYFEDNIYQPRININSAFKGQYAQYFQPYYDFLNKDEIKKMDENILRNIVPDAEIVKLSSENTGSSFFSLRPLIINAEIIGTPYIEIAGKRILFKIGELLGPQSELYQEVSREFDIESNFNREYQREINFSIPGGYKVGNLDALKMDIYFPDKNTNQKTMGFSSNYKITGNKVKVIITEYYSQILTSGDEYENFRKVINAAADFNKIVLLFNPITINN